MSRLLNNSDEFRASVETRNLYGFDNEYPKQSESAGSAIIDAVNSISSVLTPYSGYDMSNSVFGRLIEDKTPLTEIGLIMLGKQFAFSSTKKVTNETLPTIKPLNIFLKDESVIMPNINYRITKNENENFFQRFLDITTFYTPSRDNIFDEKSTNLDYLKNTGEFQLDALTANLNRNLYNNVIYLTEPTISDRIKNRSVDIIPNKTYFIANNEFTVYDYNYVNDNDWVLDGNTGMRESAALAANTYPEYAPDLDFIREYFGKTDVTPPRQVGDLQELNDWVDNDTGFRNDDDKNKIIWGRDGTSSNLRNNRQGLTGFSEDEVQRNLSYSNDLENKFNNRKGLLTYTRNLINSKGGQIGDTTRKAFKKGNEITAFNGSGLWRAPENALPEFRGREGLRQHSSVDQYDRFAKAIRFEGNQVYNGSQNSVINKTVIPKIHPILNEEGNIDNRNMMFAIENLAVVVRENDPQTNFGVIDDEYGTKIPKSEVGQFGGRVMWFPPYNLELNESSSANFESTVMVGRNEPMYNYLHSERSATVRFSMLMDYPPQLKNYQGLNKHKDISEFFAFGGEGIDYDLPDPDVPRKRIKELDEPIPSVRSYEPEIPTNKVTYYFPNDVPTKSEVNTVIDDIHKKYEYELMSNTVNYYSKHPNYVKGSGDGSGNHVGLNYNNIYLAGIVGIGKVAVTSAYLDKSKIPNDFSQYQYKQDSGLSVFRATISGGTLDNGGVVSNINEFENQTPITKLDKLLKDAFNEPLNRQALKIVLKGSATRRFEDQTKQAEYNRDLAKRRIDSIKFYIQERLKALFDNIDVSEIEFEEINVGSSDSQTTEADTPEAKRERWVEIKIERNSRDILQPRELSAIEQQQNEEIANRKQELEDLADSINRQNEYYLNERGSGDDKGLLKGFQAASGRYFSPVFHSQTPEDFHRRLTFLQQCMRQGAALKTKVEEDESGIIRARNSVFGRQPICILRIGDFFHTKVIIENLTIDYDEAPWDTNPEGFGMQPMIANITLQLKLIGGQSLRGPINALQNAVSFNYYANSTYTNQGIYGTPSGVEAQQYGNGDSITTENEDQTEQTNETLENSSRPNRPTPI
ncbi:MAG: hypothetical protein ACOC22_01960 [bacterium]